MRRTTSVCLVIMALVFFGLSYDNRVFPQGGKGLQPGTGVPQGPGSAKTLYFKARQNERDNPDEAIRIYRELAARFPKDEITGCGLLIMGGLLMKQEKYDEALEAFKRAETEFPDAKFGNGKMAAAGAAYTIALCLHKKGAEQEALKALDDASKKYPNATDTMGKSLKESFDEQIKKRISRRQWSKRRTFSSIG